MLNKHVKRHGISIRILLNFKKGSCTVEASLAMPCIFIACCLMIVCMATVYNRMLECGAAYGAAIMGSEVYREYGEDVNYPVTGEAETLKVDDNTARIIDSMAADLGKVVFADTEDYMPAGIQGRIRISYDKRIIFNETVINIGHVPAIKLAGLARLAGLTGLAGSLPSPGTTLISGATACRKVKAADPAEFIREVDLAVEYLKKTASLFGAD